jgi:hypothetical protein
LYPPSSTTLRAAPGSQNRPSTSTLTPRKRSSAPSRGRQWPRSLKRAEARLRVDAPFAELAPQLLSRAAEMMEGGRVPAIARMVIGESRNFPDLARIWHDDVVASVIGMVTGIIARAQGRGEVAPGDPRLHAFSLMGPMVMAMLFGGVAANPPDLPALADQHARTALCGLLMPCPRKPTDGGRNEAE